MTVQTHRAGWLLITFNLLLIVGLVFSIQQVLTLRNDRDNLFITQYESCVRGNTLRENERFLLTILAAMTEDVSVLTDDPRLRDAYKQYHPLIMERLLDKRLQPRYCDDLQRR